MSNIFRVMTLQVEGLEPSVEHGFFGGDDVEAAIQCAKTHINPEEPTMVQIIQLGENRGKSIVWMHHPSMCDKTCTCGRHDAISVHVVGDPDDADISGPHTKRSEQVPEGVGTQPRYQSMSAGLVT